MNKPTAKWGLLDAYELNRRIEVEKAYWKLTKKERERLFSFILKENVNEQIKQAKEEDDNNTYS